jgi:hypothetical protein
VQNWPERSAAAAAITKAGRARDLAAGTFHRVDADLRSGAGAGGEVRGIGFPPGRAARNNRNAPRHTPETGAG